MILKRIMNSLRALLGLVLIASNTLMHVLPLFLVALVKMLVPVKAVRRLCSRLLAGIAESWIAVNSALIASMTHTRFHVSGVGKLQRRGSYLVLCNHQSWVDIPVLQKVFNRRIPFMRFFLKSQLIWVPVLGLAWWALDFPFMKRHSRAALERRPELRNQDMQATRRACQRFRGIPVSIMNFVEGTRIRPEKHERQASPYRNLLRPKAGGVALVLDSMGEAVRTVLDVAIVYPQGRPSMMHLLMDQIPDIHVIVREYPVPEELQFRDSGEEREYRARVQQWLNTLWAEKDRLIEEVNRAHVSANSISPQI
ncbi:MAG: acyltransferase [Gammaproteobacteria bacterium]|nr:acyltransferase [Gammaproteobacteria bacterium]